MIEPRPMPPCEVCRDQAVAVVASMLVPYSLAVCSLCLSSCADTWPNVVFYVAERGGFEKSPDYAQCVVENTLIRAGRTREELDAEVARLTEAWEKMAEETEP
jgi:hypothetical protein